MSPRCLACSRRALPAPGERVTLCGGHAAQLLTIVAPAAPVAEPPTAEQAVVAPAAPTPAAKPAPSRRELQIREYAATLEREGYSREVALQRATEALRPCDHKQDAAPARRGELVVSKRFLHGVLLEQAGARRGGEA